MLSPRTVATDEAANSAARRLERHAWMTVGSESGFSCKMIGAAVQLDLAVDRLRTQYSVNVRAGSAA